MWNNKLTVLILMGELKTLPPRSLPILKKIMQLIAFCTKQMPHHLKFKKNKKINKRMPIT